MKDIFTLELLWSTIRLAAPLILAALGGLFSERSGVINIALEGKMLAGAFTAAAVTYAADVKLGLGTASPWLGLVSAIAAGLFLATIYGLVCIRFRADQVVSGAALNILMLGIPGFLSGALFLSSGSTPQLPKDHLLPQDPRIIGLALALIVAASWYVLYRTPFGLRLRSVGEKPEAATMLLQASHRLNEDVNRRASEYSLCHFSATAEPGQWYCGIIRQQMIFWQLGR